MTCIIFEWIQYQIVRFMLYLDLDILYGKAILWTENHTEELKKCHIEASRSQLVQFGILKEKNLQDELQKWQNLAARFVTANYNFKTD